MSSQLLKYTIFTNYEIIKTGTIGFEPMTN